MKIDCKYRYSVDFVNEEIRRRRNLAELQENDDCVFSATQESQEGSIQSSAANHDDILKNAEEFTFDPRKHKADAHAEWSASLRQEIARDPVERTTQKIQVTIPDCDGIS